MERSADCGSQKWVDAQCLVDPWELNLRLVSRSLTEALLEPLKGLRVGLVVARTKRRHTDLNIGTS